MSWQVGKLVISDFDKDTIVLLALSAIVLAAALRNNTPDIDAEISIKY